MALITLCAGLFAARFDSLLVAVLGILGGYSTPVLLATGEKNFAGLFGYVLLLGLGGSFTGTLNIHGGRVQLTDRGAGGECRVPAVARLGGLDQRSRRDRRRDPLTPA